MLDKVILNFGEQPNFDLACVGISMSGFNSITLEAIRYIRHARKVYAYPVTKQHLEWIARLNSNVVDLNDSLYADGQSFSRAYSAIIEEVFNASSQLGRIVYAQQGSPAYLASTSFLVKKKAKAAGLKVVMVPGVSSFENLLANVDYDQEITDFQSLTCKNLISKKIKPLMTLPVFLTGLSSFANKSISKERSNLCIERLEELEHYLASFYPSDHKVTGFTVYPSGRYDNLILQVKGLANSLLRSEQMLTLLIPPIA